jgi:hypothetical protein
MMRVWGWIGTLLLAGCAAAGNVGEFAASDATPEALPVCHGHGCKLRTVVSLDPAQWSSVAGAFVPLPETPAAERQQIAEAIARLEALVGAKAGTGEDAGQNQLLASTGQLDCVDETANTHTYLQLLERSGLLRFHQPTSPAHRGWPDDTWVHNTAVVAERAGGQSYAIDSWFFDNGRPAAVVPLQAWLDGWQPDDGSVAGIGDLASLDVSPGSEDAAALMPRSGAR